MRVLVAMSGGVDSSVAAALLLEQRHEAVGVTLKLWGGPSDSGCCSVADVDDARRVAQQLGIDHHVFNLAEEFEAAVVTPYVRAHAEGRTPNPCIECNRHIKFDRLLARADRLGFDALATGHHARVARRPGRPDGHRHQLRRGADPAKDQSYVLSTLSEDQLGRLLLPVGELTKAKVRARAADLGLRTADKPDSQDVCFIHGAEGRSGFLRNRLTFHPGSLVDGSTGATVGEVEALELVTVGQRRGMGHDESGRRRYVTSVDVPRRVVTLGTLEESLAPSVTLAEGSLSWTASPLPDGSAAIAQVGAHGRPVDCRVACRADGGLEVRFEERQRPVAPGQTVALYDPQDPEAVLGAGIAT